MTKRYFIISIIAIYTILQLVILFVFGYTPYPDSNGYIILATHGLQKAELYPIASEIKELAFLWNLGAINAVHLSLWLFNSIMPLLILYSVMKGMTAWILYSIVKILSSDRTALITLILYVIYPANYGEATSVLSEVPFIFFSLTATWLCVKRKWIVLAGILLAIGNYIRPFSMVFLLSIIFVFHTEWKNIIKLTSGFALTILIIGSLTSMRTGLFLYQAKTGWMALMQYSWDNSIDHTNFPTNPNVVCNDTLLNVAQKDSVWQSMFIDWVRQNKTEYIRQMPEKLINTYISDNINMCAFLPHKSEKTYMYDELSMKTLYKNFPHYTTVQWLVIFNLLYFYLLIITALLSLYYFDANKYVLPCSIIFIGTMMLLLVGHGEARFHIPFMPFFIMLAASFIDKKLWKG